MRTPGWVFFMAGVGIATVIIYIARVIAGL